MNQLATGIGWYLSFLFSLIAHEATHAFVAWRLGDSTAKKGGQVTLNPVPHIRRAPIGTVVVPIISYIAGGWMIGWASAPYDPEWARRNPHRAAVMSFSGPAANLALALLAAAVIRLGMVVGLFDSPQTLYFDHIVEAIRPGGLDALGLVLSVMFSLNLLLFFFNLMPIPPLDGSGVYMLFGGPVGDRINAALRNPIISYGGILVAWGLLRLLFPAFHDLAIKLLYPGVIYH
ncbi:MAG: site-2 protease family protein [Spirochaetia bacterium]